MANVTLQYSAATALTIGLANLANGASVNSSTIDNTTAKHLDCLIRVTVVTVTGAVTTGVVEVYARGSFDGTEFEDATNDKWVGTIGLAAAGAATYVDISSVASAFGGTLPPYIQIRLKNSTGAALAATGNSASWIGVMMASV